MVSLKMPQIAIIQYNVRSTVAVASGNAQFCLELHHNLLCWHASLVLFFLVLHEQTYPRAIQGS